MYELIYGNYNKFTLNGFVIIIGQTFLRYISKIKLNNTLDAVVAAFIIKCTYREEGRHKCNCNPQLTHSCV